MTSDLQAHEDEYFEMELLDFVGEVARVKTEVEQKKTPGSEKTEIVNCIVNRLAKPESKMPEDQLVRLIQALNILAQTIYLQPNHFLEWPTIKTLYDNMKTYRATNPDDCIKAHTTLGLLPPPEKPSFQTAPITPQVGSKRPLENPELPPAKIPFKQIKLDLPPPKHTPQELDRQSKLQNKLAEFVEKIDERLVFGQTIRNQTGVCAGFQSNACTKPIGVCPYKHICWQCLGPHQSIKCPIAPLDINAAKGPEKETCMRWNLTGCKMGYLCNMRHVCVFCKGSHPIRHAKYCLSKFQQTTDGEQKILKHFKDFPINSPNIHFHNNIYKPGQIKKAVTDTEEPEKIKYMPPIVTRKLTSNICLEWNISDSCLCDAADCGFEHICLLCHSKHKLLKCPFFPPWVNKFRVGDCVQYGQKKGLLTEIHQENQRTTFEIKSDTKMYEKIELRGDSRNKCRPLFSKQKQVFECQSTNQIFVSDLPIMSEGELQRNINQSLQSNKVVGVEKWELVEDGESAVFYVPEKRHIPQVLDAIGDLKLKEVHLRPSMMSIPAKKVFSKKFSSVFYCELCDVEFYNKADVETHVLETGHLHLQPKLLAEAIKGIGTDLLGHCRVCNVEVKSEDAKNHLNSETHKQMNFLLSASVLNMQLTEKGEVKCECCQKEYKNLVLFMIHCRTPYHRANLENMTEPCVLFNCRAGCPSTETCEHAHVCVGCRGPDPYFRCTTCHKNASDRCLNYNKGSCWIFPRCKFKHCCCICGQRHPKVGCPYSGAQPRVYDDYGKPAAKS